MTNKLVEVILDQMEEVLQADGFYVSRRHSVIRPENKSDDLPVIVSLFDSTDYILTIWFHEDRCRLYSTPTHYEINEANAIEKTDVPYGHPNLFEEVRNLVTHWADKRRADRGE